MKKHALLVISFILIQFLNGNCNAQTEKSELTNVNLQLKWIHQFQFAGFYAAKEKGFYNDVGLNVNIIEGKPGTNFFEEVLRGNAHFGIELPDILIERFKGNPFVILGVIFQHSPLVLVSKQKSKINSPHNLIGKTIMLRADGDLTLKALFKGEGLTSNDVNIINHTWKPSDLLEDKVDAMSAYLTDVPSFFNKDSIQLLNPINYGIDFYGDCIFTTEEFIDENPDIVEAFLSATYKGWNYAMQNKEELAEIIRNKYHSLKTKDNLIYEADVMEELILPKFIEIGHMNPGRWEHIANTYRQLGLIDRNYKLDGLLYNPNTGADYTKLFTIIWIFSGILFLTILGTITLFIFNKKLHSEVEKRTNELKEAKVNAEKSEKIKTEFLAQMSHEIRSPINTILSFVSLIEEELKNKIDDLMFSSFASINNAGKRIIRTIDLILNMSEVQTGTYEIITKKINLRTEILDKLKTEYSVEAKRKNLELNFIYPEENVFIYADEYSIMQVFANLINNALKYTDTGSVTIKTYRESNHNISIDIVDTGVGISEEYLPYLFTPFSQEEQGYSRKFEGNGLGLALVKSYCDLNKADLSIKSKKGKGTIITISFDDKGMNQFE